MSVSPYPCEMITYHGEKGKELHEILRAVADDIEQSPTAVIVAIQLDLGTGEEDMGCYSVTVFHAHTDGEYVTRR